MKQKKRIPIAAMILLLSLCLIASVSVGLAAVFAAPTVDEVHSITLEEDGVTQEELAAMAIDPQSWQLQREMTWDDYKPNPVIDWMDELNPDSLDNKFAYEDNPERNRKIIGGLLMYEYLDRKFISRGDMGSDPLGYYLYNTDGSGLQEEVSNNPVLDVYKLIADEKYAGDRTEVTDDDFINWWADYLNTPQAINNFSGIDEFWRENSYGKWATELRPYGTFTIPYFEFETMGYDTNSDFQTYRDIPPSFRFGDPGTMTEAEMKGWNCTNNPTLYPDNIFGRRFDNIAHQMAVDEGVPFEDFDFFFLLHAGYDESGVWQEFGQAQFKTRQDVPYELGPGPRMEKVEEFFTENPEYLEIYADRYKGHLGEATFRDAWDEYNELVEEGKEAEFEFRLSDEDWDWADSYNDIETKNTRYVSFTSWEAAVGEWSHAGSYNYKGRSIPRSTQGENDGMATFAHEFGHISGIADNYGNPWLDAASAATEPWELMSRGSFAGPFGDHARWTVPGIEAGSIPTHFMQRNKEFINFYGEGEMLELSVQELAGNTPIVAEVVARNIPLANEFYQDLEDDYGLISPDYYKAIKLRFGADDWADKATLVTTGFTWTRKAASSIAVEVVDRNGYDSFNHDHGVLLSRVHTNTGNPYQAIIDSHLGDIAMIDFELNGEFAPYPLAHTTQLADAAFHAGVSFVDTGYYATEYGTKVGNNPADWEVIKPGSIVQWEPRDGRAIVSGNTVNEFYDEANKLHFYILDKHLTPGKAGREFLSYSVAMRHDDGPEAGGELTLTKGDFSEASEGNYAVQEYILELSDDAIGTDIVRVGLEGDLKDNTVILNNLFAIEPGGEIRFSVYIKAIDSVLESFPEGLEVTVSSETAASPLGDVNLITDKEIEIIYCEPVESDEEAQEIFTVLVDGKEVEWEYLSYFDFGDYADDPVVNIRLKEALQIRSRSFIQNDMGDAAAARVTVELKDDPAEVVTAEWKPFYTYYDALSSGGAGSTGQWGNRGSRGLMWVWGNEDSHCLPGPLAAGGIFDDIPMTNRNTYAGKTAAGVPNAIAQMTAGIDRTVGRSELLVQTAINSGMHVVVVGNGKSVYAVPEFRQLYEHGKTTDTFSRVTIGGSRDIPIIVTTAEDVYRVKSPNDNTYEFMRVFAELFLDLGVIDGWKNFPLGPYDQTDSYDCLKRLGAAFENSKAENLWPGTNMLNSLKDYYVLGVMIYFECIPESSAWGAEAFPINTRREMLEYDPGLYKSLAEIHGEWEYHTGGAANQLLDSARRWTSPWYKHSQTDNYTVVDGVVQEYEPLKVVETNLISPNQVELIFNREVKDLDDLRTLDNWEITWTPAENVTVSLPGTSGTFVDKTYTAGETYTFSAGTDPKLVMEFYMWKTLTLKVTAHKFHTGYMDYEIGGFTEEEIEKAFDDTLSIEEGYKPWFTEDGYYRDLNPIGRTFMGDMGDISGWQADTDTGSARTFYAVSPKVLAAQTPEKIAAMKLEEAMKIPREAFYGKPSALEKGEYVRFDAEKGGYISYDKQNKPLNGGAVRFPAAINGTLDVKLKAGSEVKDWAGNALEAKTYAVKMNPWEKQIMRSEKTGVYVYADKETQKNSLLVGCDYWDQMFAGTYDNLGQRMADGFNFFFYHQNVKTGEYGLGGLEIMGYHNHMFMASNRRSQYSYSGTTLYAEGLGYGVCSTGEYSLLRDYTATRYKHESIMHHEGAHSVEYPGMLYFTDLNFEMHDIWDSVGKDTWMGSQTYAGGSPAEWFATLSTYWLGTMRESVDGSVTGVWTGISTREELFTYDPAGYEFMKKTYYNGETYLDPTKLPEPWTGNTKIPGWDGDGKSINDDIIKWGVTNPGTMNEDRADWGITNQFRWTSWGSPNMWDINGPPGAMATLPGSGLRYEVGVPNPDYPGREVYGPNYNPYLLEYTYKDEFILVNISTVSGTGGTVTGGKVYAQDVTVTLKAIPDPGFVFEGWYEGDIKIAGAGAEYSFPATAARTLEARFEIKIFSLRYSGEPADPTIKDYVAPYHIHGTPPAAVSDLEYGDEVIIAGRCDEPQFGLHLVGHNFVGWTEDNNWDVDSDAIVYHKEDKFIIGDSDVVLYSVWEREPEETEYWAKYDLNGGRGVVPADQGPYQNFTHFIPATNEGNTFYRGGFEFLGWSEDRAATTPDPKHPNGTLAIEEQDMTLYAVWKSVGTGSSGSSTTTFTVTFNSNGGSTVTSKLVVLNTRVLKPADPTREGYTFAGWYTDADLTTAYNFDALVTRNFTLYAKWTEDGDGGEEGNEFPFTDVAESAWYYEYIKSVYDLGLMNGTGDTTFSPNLSVTRGMLVTVLHRMEDTPEVEEPASFSDVSAGTWYTDAVAWAEAEGIVEGYPDGTFKPNQNVSRQELATVLLRYAKFIGKEQISSSPDDPVIEDGDEEEADDETLGIVPITAGLGDDLDFVDAAKIGDWAKEGVAFCAKNGIIEGRPGKIFDPAAFATRGEFAAMLHRFLVNIK
ncbi:MAG: S-layer homology domain-containing protein [Clostridiales bacterium]|nr:S-layer homology domain-containing protein [Clostridiales bacterium]